MLGNDSVAEYLFQLQKGEFYSAIIFWFSFIIIMSFLIFNILIAIIVEAFVQVKVCQWSTLQQSHLFFIFPVHLLLFFPLISQEEFAGVPSAITEVNHILKSYFKQIFSSTPSNKTLLSQLKTLGALNKEVVISEAIFSKKRGNQILNNITDSHLHFSASS